MTDSARTAPVSPAVPALTAARRPLAYDRVALVLAALALLVLAIIATFQWRDREALEIARQELARRISDGDAANREAQAQARVSRETADALQAKVGVLEAKLAEMQSQQMALEAMYQELSRLREDRLVAEIEQDVAVAAQQLQLAGNVEAALIALAGAEARLARNAQPQFLPLRKLISRDIENLKALPAADISGIALKLDGLINAVPDLPLAFEQRPAAVKGPEKATSKVVPPAAVAVPPAPTFADTLRAWGGELWGELRQLVRIERIDRPDPGLLAPREVFFLRENLRLRLLAARLALLARDARSFKSDIAQAQRWLGDYFDLRAASVGGAKATLAELARIELAREPVALGETLSALRNFKFGRDRGHRSDGGDRAGAR